jgi:thioredoxin-related protein
MNIRTTTIIASVLLTAFLCRAGDLNWLTDYDAAVAQAGREGKAVLVDFTGSDWCGWCMKLKAEIFDTPEFAAFAHANLVLLEVDFPKHKKLSAEQQRKNDALQEKFGVEGFPTLFVLNASGKPSAKAGYMSGGPLPFIAALKRAPGINWRDVSSPEPKKSTPPPAETLTAPVDPWAGMPTSVKRYDELKLTGLSGTASRRFALVNNQTFAPGETARVKLKDGEVKVLCKEIRERSILIQIEGTSETKELFLNGH